MGFVSKPQKVCVKWNWDKEWTRAYMISAANKGEKQNEHIMCIVGIYIHICNLTCTYKVPCH